MDSTTKFNLTAELLSYNKKELEQINKDYDDTTKCLITDDYLCKPCITLQCNHSFNPIPFYKDLLFCQKISPTNKQATKKCPYCRQPFISYTTDIFPYMDEWNIPKLATIHYGCFYIFKKGKNKGKMCMKKACSNNICKTHLQTFLKIKNGTNVTKN